jgi:uncharacterized protein YbaA (DUF1428 family)
MSKYVDGFVLPVPKRNMSAYRRMAAQAGKIWRDHGALDYKECVGDDLNIKMGMPFPRGIRSKPGENACSTGDSKFWSTCSNVDYDNEEDRPESFSRQK